MSMLPVAGPKGYDLRRKGAQIRLSPVGSVRTPARMWASNGRAGPYARAAMERAGRRRGERGLQQPGHLDS